ncbi:MAG TPA: hypothetical protein VK601_10400 [Kofleriaceae bacterium]|nr:hypothetical protein [Kofleriaceae bacterium]
MRSPHWFRAQPPSAGPPPRGGNARCRQDLRGAIKLGAAAGLPFGEDESIGTAALELTPARLAAARTTGFTTALKLGGGALGQGRTTGDSLTERGEWWELFDRPVANRGIASASLPVPVSPSITIGMSEAASRSISGYSRRIAALSPSTRLNRLRSLGAASARPARRSTRPSRRRSRPRR